MAEKGFTIEKEVIVINRELTELDLFVKKFLDILKKHADYLVVSGFVSISTGRTRGTEDIDVLVPVMTQEKFKALFDELIKNNFWCYQGEKAEEIHSYLKRFSSIRWAEEGTVFPNIEFVPIDQSRKAKWFEFTHPQKFKIDGFEFKIPPLEFEILYKEIVLKGKKDFEDARHLRTFFSAILQKENFIKFKPIIENEAK